VGGGATTANGTITIGTTNPAAASHITLGPPGDISTYTFRATVGANSNVLKGATATLSAENLRAAIDANSAECGSAAPCFGSLITSPNAAVNHPAPITTGTANIITLTAVQDGAAGNFAITSNTGNITVSGSAGTQGNGANDGLNFLVEADQTITAANFVLAINRPGNGSSVTVTASNVGATVTLDSTAGASIGDATTVATTFTPSPAFGSPLSGGSDAQATIGAFTNLYSSCTAPVPTPYWAYNTGASGGVVTSPVLSGDGTQVAFIQNGAASSNLVLLKWKANDGTFLAPTTPTNSATASDYQTCVPTVTACMFTIPFNTTGGSPDVDVNSSPFYDYSTDTLYVGNDDGFLHKFTGVFKGSPAEVVSAGVNIWPALISAGDSLTSPVFVDGAGGNGAGVSGIFVGDSSNVTLYRVDATIGSGASGLVPSGVLGSAGIDDSPLVDSSTGNVYVFIRTDDGNSEIPSAGVCQFSVNFSSGDSCTVAGGNEVLVSSDTVVPAVNFFPGAFDNTYFSSIDGTGSMYVCGTSSGGLATLWQITVTAGVLSASTPGPTLTTGNQECSPVTEFPNGAADWIFLSVTDGAVGCTTATGCIMSFDVSAGMPPGADSTANETGGTSGIVVDGSSAVVGASQVYFTPLADQTCTTSGGTGGCAIQAAQSGLN